MKVKCTLSDKSLLHSEHWWGRSLVGIAECLVKAPYCVKCTLLVWHRHCSRKDQIFVLICESFLIHMCY